MEAVVKPWRTCDLKAAAFLLYAGFAVVSMGKEQSRAFFEFDDTKERSNALLAFWNKEQRVEPVAFLDSLNRARDMVTQTLKS